MTMSDIEVQVSESSEKSERRAAENGIPEGQEVNNAKCLPADGGVSLLQTADDKCADRSEENFACAEQSPSKGRPKRCISFPSASLVSGYCDPPDPWKPGLKWTQQDILSAYRKSCEKHGAKPISKVLQQIEALSCNGKREDKLLLKGEKLDNKHCETFEEILRRVQFKTIDLESCHLDDETAVAWFDMIEYYESACHLNISYNKNISIRGWQACSRLIRRTPCLTTLDLRNCDMNDRSIPIFGRALKLGSHLTVLHMENMYLSGRSLIILVAALKMNEYLQELFLADNRLMPSDGIQLGNLLKYNHSLALLDLRNNHLQDVGVGHVCDGLYEQNLDKGLRTLVLWNNQVTYQAMASLSRALGSTKCLETLNLGHNNVTNEGIHILKDGLLKSKSLLRLGLQSTRLTCEGAVALAEYVADSFHLLRLDLRENDIKTAGLMALSLALKVNQSVTRMDIDKETKKESGMKDYADQQRRLQQEIRSFLERNQQGALAREEEERRRLEERAEVEMAARQSVQAAITSAHNAVNAQPQVIYMPASSPEPQSKLRPILMLDVGGPSRLTPQDSLESPHCTDVHFPPEATETAEGEGAGIPLVAVTSASSPPFSLQLSNPLTEEPETKDSMGLPIVNPITAALRSPPVELLLSPQYYPKPTARKIFNVSRVVEASPASPTVSKTGLLDTGATSPAMKLAPSSAGQGAQGGASPVSPTLLCQDLSAKTVNDYIQQIVADTDTQQGDVGSGDLDLDPMEGSGGQCYDMDSAMQAAGGDVPQKQQGALKAEREEEGCGDLDPLGVLQAPVPSSGVASSEGCDTVTGGGLADTSQSGGDTPVQGEEQDSDTALTVGDDKVSAAENIPQGKLSVGAPSLSSAVDSAGQSSDDSGSQVAGSQEKAKGVGDGANEEVAGRFLVEKSQLEGTEVAALSPPKMSEKPVSQPREGDPEPSPLFKAAGFPDFSITDEDLSLFGAVSNSSALSASPSQQNQQPPAAPAAEKGGKSAGPAVEQVGKSSGSEPSAREVSPGANDTWMAVDAPSLGDQAEKEGGQEAGEGPPDFFTALSLNGLTQELASALSSIDDASTTANTELHIPDEFEQELNAMLASVKNELPWPLQQDQPAASSMDDESEQKHSGSTSTA